MHARTSSSAAQPGIERIFLASTITCPSLHRFAEDFALFLSNYAGAPAVAGRVHDVDAHPDVGGYPMICALWWNPSVPSGADHWAFLFIMGTSGTPLDQAALENECPATAALQLAGEGASLAVGRVGTIFAPKLAEAFAMVFSTDIEVTPGFRAWTGDGALHTWEFAIEATGVRFFSISIVDMGAEPTTGTNPHWAGHTLDFNPAEAGWVHYRGNAGSDQNAPLGATGGGGGGGGGGSVEIDLTPVTDKLGEIKEAIDDISIGASVNHGAFEVAIRGADGGDGEGGGGG